MCNQPNSKIKMTMEIPTKEEVLNALVEELAYDQIKIGGDISSFQEVLYTGFLKYIKRKKYKEELLYTFVADVADSMLEEEEPHNISDITHLAQKGVS